MTATSERVIIEESTPLPCPQIYIVLFVRFIEPISFALLFPFVYFMVRDFHITNDPNQIGYYAGFIASSFALAEFLSGIPWGILSDKIGRKPVIMIGLFGTMVSMILFGLSKSLAWAMATRFMAGALSGNVGVLKSMVGEMTDRSNRAKGFSYLTLSFGLGLIVGPSLGGFLSRPVESFPNVFGFSIFTPFLVEYPYFLPCGVASFFCAIGLVVAYFYLEETWDITSKTSHLLKKDSLVVNYGTVSSDFAEAAVLPKESEKISKASWYVIFSQMGLSLLSVMLEELFPFWAATPISKGGLAYDSKSIGLTITCAGFVLILIQVVIFPLLQLRFGTLIIYRIVFLVYVPIILLFPLVGTLTRVGLTDLAWVAVLTIYSLRTCCGVVAYTSLNILLPESCPSKSILGKVNGIAQALASLARAIGPGLCGYIFSWSLGNNLPYPLDYHTTFYFVSLISIVTYLLVRRIKPEMVLH